MNVFSCFRLLYLVSLRVSFNLFFSYSLVLSKTNTYISSFSYKKHFILSNLFVYKYANKVNYSFKDGLRYQYCTFTFKARCRLPTNQGPCNSTLTRWGFNKDTYSCETFIYGGCGGTGNNFLSRRDCLIHCNGGKTSV